MVDVLQLLHGLPVTAPCLHGAGGQLDRTHAGERTPGGLLAQNGHAGLIESHLQGVLHHMVDLFRGVVQLLGGDVGGGGFVFAAAADPGGDDGGLPAPLQGEAGGVLLTGVKGGFGVLRLFAGEEHEHHLLHGVVVALRLPGEVCLL